MILRLWLLLKLNRKSWVAGLLPPLVWPSDDRKWSKRRPIKIKHFSRGCNSETDADRAKVTIEDDSMGAKLSNGIEMRNSPISAAILDFSKWRQMAM